MKKLLSLVLALCIPAMAQDQTTPTTPEVATPEVATPEVATPEVATPEVATPEVATPEAAPTLVPNPGVDPAAVALLDKSAKAYAALNSASMQFNAFDEDGDKTNSASGTIAFERPGKIKLQFKTGPKSMLLLSDGGKLTMQARPEEYLSKPVQTPDNPDTLPSILQSVPSALALILPPLVAGESPLVITQIQWQKATLLPDNGVELTANTGPANPPALFRLYFDPTDHLLRRLEAELTLRGKKTVNISTLTGVQVNPSLPAETFAFTPAEGVKLVAQQTPYNPALKVGAAPTPLVGRDLKGFAHPWSQYLGKVVLLHFWTTRLPASTAEIPVILRNLTKHQAAGFRALGVSLDSDKNELQQFLKANKMSYPQIFDGRGPQTVDVQRYELQALPFSLLIGKDGKIAAVSPRGAELDKAIQKALVAK